VPDGAEFISQLTSPDRVFDVRPRCPPPARRAGPAAAGRPGPCVLLLSRSCDAELHAVQDLLGRAGIPVCRVDSEELAACDLVIDPASRAVRVNGRWLMPTVTWIRHFSPRAIGAGAVGPAGTVSQPDPASPAPGMFLRASWRAAADQIATVSGACLRPGRPGLLAQSLLAREHRLPVPRTIVTTDLAAARAAFTCRRLVIKAAHDHFVEAEPGRLTGIFPTVIERLDLPARPCPGPPVVVQEYVEHDAELRVYYVAGQVHAFEVSKASPADPWTDPDKVRVRQVTAPPAASAGARALGHALGLRFAAFDFLLRDAAPVFLEVNPDGDWRWAERKSRAMVVTPAVSGMLAGLHHAARRSTPAAAGGTGPFDLLAFLSAAGPR
jgi:hypothetical protein